MSFRCSQLLGSGLLWSLLVVRMAVAGDFVFEIPQLSGASLQNSSLDIALDLGMEFAEIERATLQITGTQVLGSYADLNFPGSFPLSMEIFAHFSLENSTQLVYVDEILPTNENTFELNEPFRVGCCGNSRTVQDYRLRLREWYRNPCRWRCC